MRGTGRPQYPRRDKPSTVRSRFPRFSRVIDTIGPGPRALAGRAQAWVQPRLEGLVGEAFDVGPPEAGGTGPSLNTRHRPQPDARLWATSRWVWRTAHFWRRRR